MKTRLAASYGIDRLPIEPLPAGTNVLVTGSPLDGAREILFELLARTSEEEGLIFVTADTDYQSAVETYEDRASAFDPSRMCVIDATQAPEGAENASVRYVSSPSDLTGIGIEFSSLYESLRASGLDQIRFGLDSISTLLIYADGFRPVYRFLHTITSRIRTADGLGVFTIDPDAVEDEAFATVAQSFDVRVDVRDGEDGPEFRLQGHEGRPEGWHAL
ncbi:MAG: hypothetical protein ABEI57_05970 [Halapricum sp.]